MFIVRFIERDYVSKMVKSNREYITDEQIERLLSEYSWSDLTFKFISKKNGFQSIIIDNETESLLTVNELEPPAYDFYIRQVEELSKRLAKTQFNKARYA